MVRAMRHSGTRRKAVYFVQKAKPSAMPATAAREYPGVS
jgi:hypothetical protein